MINPKELEYDFCNHCGCMVGVGVKVCNVCRSRGFGMIKKSSITELRYPEVPDPMDWLDPSEGYTEELGRMALKELMYELQELKAKSDNSRKVG